MNRRWFWISLAIGILSLLALDAAAADRTRFYRVAKIDNVWWFIGSERKPVFSSGVNVIDPGPTPDEYDSRRSAYAAFRHYPDRATWASKAQQRLEQWGFTIVGSWSAPELTKGPFPYVEVLHVGGKLGAPFNDLFHADYAAISM